MAESHDVVDKDHGQASDPVYAYRPSLMGASYEFRLRPDALEWAAGYSRGRVPYQNISRIRLSFRPATMQSQRYVTEIWIPGRPRLTIASTSMRGMLDQQRHDADYRAFVGELVSRIAAAGGRPTFATGSPPLLFWPGLAIFIVVAITFVVLLIRALASADWSGLAFVAAFFALFLWQVGAFFRRNWPGTFEPNVPPERVLPP
jgi:hypothetical protein